MPELKIGGKTKHYKYTKKGKKKYFSDLIKSLTKKKKKKLPYGQIPSGSEPENPIGGN